MNTIKLQSRLFLLLAGLCAALSCSLSTARGELLFSDSFEYGRGTLNREGPPAGAPPGQTGWTRVNGDPDVLVRGLRFLHLASAGESAGLLGLPGDHAAAGLTPTTSGVVWLGYLLELRKGDDGGFAVINLGNKVVGGPGFGVLYNSHVFGIDNDTGLPGDQVFSTVSPSQTPSWLVVKLDFTAGTQSLYVNPATANDQPAAQLMMTADFQATGFDHVFLHVGINYGSWIYDEVRIGTTFFDIQRTR